MSSLHLPPGTTRSRARCRGLSSTEAEASTRRHHRTQRTGEQHGKSCPTWNPHQPPRMLREREATPMGGDDDSRQSEQVVRRRQRSRIGH